MFVARSCANYGTHWAKIYKFICLNYQFFVCCVLGDDARKQWELLRDVFRKKTKETKGVSGASAKPKWVYFESLSFLIPMMKARNTTGNLSVSDTSMSQVLEEREGEALNETDFTELDGNTDAEVDDLLEEGNISAPTNTPVEPQRKGLKRKQATSIQDKALDLERRKVQLMEARFAAPQTNQVEDDDLSFFKSLLPSMKQLSDIRRMKLRSQILNCVIAELEAPREPNTSWLPTAASRPPPCPSGSGHHYANPYASSSDNSSSAPSPYHHHQHSGQGEQHFTDLY